MIQLTRLLAVAALALGLIACDDIIIPDDPRGGGRGDDSTGNDTNRISVLSLSGPIVNGLDSSALQIPAGADVVVAWDRGNGELYVYGQGEISTNAMRGHTYSVTVSTDNWNDDALFDPDASGGIHGIGMVMMVDKDTPNHTIIKPSNTLPFLGQVFEANIIYNTGKEKATPWTIGWLDAFNIGLSLGVPAFNGWVPSNNGMYPLVYLGN